MYDYINIRSYMEISGASYPTSSFSSHLLLASSEIRSAGRICG